MMMDSRSCWMTPNIADRLDDLAFLQRTGSRRGVGSDKDCAGHTCSRRLAIARATAGPHQEDLKTKKGRVLQSDSKNIIGKCRKPTQDLQRKIQLRQQRSQLKFKPVPEFKNRTTKANASSSQRFLMCQKSESRRLVSLQCKSQQACRSSQKSVTPKRTKKLTKILPCWMLTRRCHR